MSTQLGCIRFRNDAPVDAGLDSGGNGTPPDENDGSTPVEGGDAVVIPAPVCVRFNPSVAGAIAGDLITQVTVTDCRLRRHFANLPPIAVAHLQECLTAQIAQVMGCLHPDGTPFKYPIRASDGQYCRDMKSSHLAFTLSDGDFNAFIADFDVALDGNGLNADERMRVLTVFGATRNDIVRLKDAGPTAPCDAPDAN